MFSCPKYSMVTALIAIGACAAASPTLAEQSYDPKIDPSDFTTRIENPYFSLPVGRKMIYEAQSENGVERIEITVSGETRTILGVETLVYSDRTFVQGKLHEVTKDFLAQDRTGNVWYFGEEVDNYTDGKLRDHKGSWIAGIDGARPGIWIKAKLIPGDVYRQEYYKGHAEDMARVASINESVKLAAGSFENCAKILEWTPIEPTAMEHKYYCPETSGLVLIEHLRTGGRVALVKIENGD